MPSDSANISAPQIAPTVMRAILAPMRRTIQTAPAISALTSSMPNSTYSTPASIMS